jgi:phosphatidylserine decarboxylase
VSRKLPNSYQRLMVGTGGSTIVCLFEKGAMHFDEDLVQNGRASIETLVRMGMGIGHATKGRQ